MIVCGVCGSQNVSANGATGWTCPDCGKSFLSEPNKKKVSYIGAPNVFLLDQACHIVNEAFGDFGCYLVGSSLEGPGWRDVDIRFMMTDENFEKEFPHSGGYFNKKKVNYWEHDPKWLLLTTVISEFMKSFTGLPIDFQFQPVTWANEAHKNQRRPMGLRIIKFSDEENDA